MKGCLGRPADDLSDSLTNLKYGREQFALIPILRYNHATVFELDPCVDTFKSLILNGFQLPPRPVDEDQEGNDGSRISVEL